MKTSSGSNNSHQYTHEYVYHHEIKKDVYANNNVLQSYIFSPKCGMKFVQHQIDWARNKKNHESARDSSEHNRCTHVDVYNHNVNKDVAANVNNVVL